MLEVVVPALIPPVRLLESLALDIPKPDLVTIVSNEFQLRDLHPVSLDVRVLHFASDSYCIGDHDVVLRRNVGIWAARGDHLVFQDDDQVAGRGMVRSSAERLTFAPSFWGHHRFLDFGRRPTLEILNLRPMKGRAREHPPNSLHGWQSCYAGMFGAHRDYLIDLGGFDMAFMGRHGSEDQDLGRRMLARERESRVFIWEPPFAWHPPQSPPRAVRVTNSCGDHMLGDPGGRAGVRRCRRCPYYRADIVSPVGTAPKIAFDPDLVQWWEP